MHEAGETVDVKQIDLDLDIMLFSDDMKLKSWDDWCNTDKVRLEADMKVKQWLLTDMRLRAEASLFPTSSLPELFWALNVL